jgi:hypothetical protein
MASLLRVPLPKAQDLLRDRIDYGSDILQNLAIKANESRYIPLYQTWHEYNIELLRGMFSGSRYESEYRRRVTNAALNQLPIAEAIRYLSSLLERLPLIEQVEVPPNREEVDTKRNADLVIFIGHGRSAIWKDLRDFIRDRLQMSFEEFNRIPTAGVSVTDRLAEMLTRAHFALLVLTGEDEQADGSLNPRLNVVHEAGLFQGKLGLPRAIVLLEHGCQEFSNIHGLGHIRFPKGNIKASFEEIREVLEREGLLPRARNR